MSPDDIKEVQCISRNETCVLGIKVQLWKFYELYIENYRAEYAAKVPGSCPFSFIVQAPEAT